MDCRRLADPHISAKIDRPGRLIGPTSHCKMAEDGLAPSVDLITLEVRAATPPQIIEIVPAFCDDFRILRHHAELKVPVVECGLSKIGRSEHHPTSTD